MATLSSKALRHTGTPGWRCLILLGASSLALSACSSEVASPPRLVLPNTSLHLGKGTPGETLTGTIPISNTGKQVLRIERLEAGCGCASLRLTGDTVEPGGQILLEVAVLIKEEGQHLQFPVRFFSNDPVTPMAVYTVRADAVPPPLRADPAQLDFGQVPVGGSPVRRVALLKPDGSSCPATEDINVESSHGPVQFRTVRQAREGVPDSLTLEVQVRNDLPLGHFQDTATVRTADRQFAATVAVSGQVVPKVIVSPTSVYFGDVDPRSSPLKRTVLLRRSDGQPWTPIIKTIAPEALDVSEIGATDAATSDKPKRLQLTLNPARTSQDLKDGKVLIWLEGDTEPITIRVLVFLARTADSPE